jgi:hypothetical protein
MYEFDLCESEGVLEMGSLHCVVLVLAQGGADFYILYYHVVVHSSTACILVDYVLLYFFLWALGLYILLMNRFNI